MHVHCTSLLCYPLRRDSLCDYKAPSLDDGEKSLRITASRRICVLKLIERQCAAIFLSTATHTRCVRRLLPIYCLWSLVNWRTRVIWSVVTSLRAKLDDHVRGTVAFCCRNRNPVVKWWLFIVAHLLEHEAGTESVIPNHGAQSGIHQCRDSARVKVYSRNYATA